MAVASEAANMFPDRDDWSSCPGKRGIPRSENQLEFSIPNFFIPPEQYLLVSNIDCRETSPPDEKSTRFSADTATFRDFEHPVSPSSPRSFSAMNTNSVKIEDDSYSISPLQTRFIGDTLSYDSNTTFWKNDSEQSENYSNPSQRSNTVECNEPTKKHRRHDSIHHNLNSKSCTTSSRRKSDSVEPGSARAIYLEKNRKAASKCRVKQKKQQEDLIETARDVERRNKVLKSEVEFLKSDLRDLMELVGKHHECPDGRLRRYIQLEADRLANKGGEIPVVAGLLSSKVTSKGSVSPEES
ncbi:hypothetical protein N0V90_011385 [Kalmusia sp. IMI 367209]|nr:hypothetical protein N0V90_011385 [Kalmusia sp. IMI 367209]